MILFKGSWQNPMWDEWELLLSCYGDTCFERTGDLNVRFLEGLL